MFVNLMGNGYPSSFKKGIYTMRNSNDECDDDRTIRTEARKELAKVRQEARDARRDSLPDRHAAAAYKAFALAEGRNKLSAEKIAGLKRGSAMSINFLKAYGGQACSEEERQQAKRQLYKQMYGGSPETPPNADLIKHDWSEPSNTDNVKHDFSDPYCVSDGIRLCKNCG